MQSSPLPIIRSKNDVNPPVLSISISAFNAHDLIDNKDGGHTLKVISQRNGKKIVTEETFSKDAIETQLNLLLDKLNLQNDELQIQIKAVNNLLKKLH